jgi:hypothetical protein
VLDNLHQLLIPRQDSFIEMNNYAEKIKSMYDEDPILKQFDHVGHRRSIVDLYPNDEESDFEIRGSILSRRNSAIPSVASHHNLNMMMTSSVHSQVGGVDTLDHVANVTAQHDTLYSYHYMDETDKTVSQSRPRTLESNFLTDESLNSFADEVHQNL